MSPASRRPDPTTAAHAEIARVDVGADALRIRGSLVGTTEQPPGLVARRRADGHEAAGAVSFDGERFDAALDFASLPWLADDEAEFWDLWLGDLRLGRHLDDVQDKRHAYAFALRELTLPAGQRRFRPFYDRHNDLFVRTGPVKQAAPADRPSGPRARRRVAPPQELAVHRAALALGAALLRRRPARDGTARVTILIADAFAMGGTVRTCMNVAGHLARDREVEIISLHRSAARPFFRFPEGVSVRVVDDLRERSPAGRAGRVRKLLRGHRSRLIFPGDLRIARSSSLWTDVRLLQLLWRAGDGVVMATRPSLNLLAPMMSRRRTAVIGQEHMNLETHTPQRQAEIGRRYGALDTLAVLTESDRATYARALGDVRLERIPNAVPALDAPAATLDRPVVVAAGRLTLQKGFDLLIPAFAQVVERHPDWTLRICGAGPQRRALERLIAEHDVANNVLLMGAVDRLDLQMAQASLYVLSSRFEGLPMVMIEAMSLGLPIVSFDCPTGPGDVLENGRSGLLVPPQDVDALAQAMLSVIENPERRRALGAGAAARANDFTLDAIGPRWEALIAELSAAAAG